jgi:hypothetical protein
MAKLIDTLKTYSVIVSVLCALLSVGGTATTMAIAWGTIRTQVNQHTIDIAAKASKEQVDAIAAIQRTKTDLAVFNTHDEKDEIRLSAIEAALKELRDGQNQILRLLIDKKVGAYPPADNSKGNT